MPTCSYDSTEQRVQPEPVGMGYKGEPSHLFCAPPGSWPPLPPVVDSRVRRGSVSASGAVQGDARPARGGRQRGAGGARPEWRRKKGFYSSFSEAARFVKSKIHLVVPLSKTFVLPSLLSPFYSEVGHPSLRAHLWAIAAGA